MSLAIFFYLKKILGADATFVSHTYPLFRANYFPTGPDYKTIYLIFNKITAYSGRS